MDVRLDYADNVLITVNDEETVVRRGQTVTLTQEEWDALETDVQALFTALGQQDGWGPWVLVEDFFNDYESVAPDFAPRFRKNASHVELWGQLQGGAGGAPHAFVLPEGYRPDREQYRLTLDDANNLYAVYVELNGNVSIWASDPVNPVEHIHIDCLLPLDTAIPE